MDIRGLLKGSWIRVLQSMSNLVRSPKVPQETLWRTVGPTGLPVTLAQAKEHLNLSPSDTTHDSKLTSMIGAATVR